MLLFVVFVVFVYSFCCLYGLVLVIVFFVDLFFMFYILLFLMGYLFIIRG